MSRSWENPKLPFFGSLPQGWKVCRVEHVATHRPSRVSPDSISEESVSLYSIPSLQETGEPEQASPDSIGSDKISLAGGEILISRLNPRKGLVVQTPRVNDGRLLASSEFVPLDPREIDARYLYFVLASNAFTRLLASAVQSATRSHQRVRPSEVLKAEIPIPQKSEQKAIADFLDRETDHIDSLIEKKGRLISLLEEKRSALVTRAVTTGLDPDVRMKNLGIEWMGEIPEHWEAVQIRRVCQVESGHTPTRSEPEYWQDGGIPWVSLADTSRLREAEFVSQTEHQISEAGLTHSSARMLPSGSVLFTRDASVGLAAIAGTELTVSQHLIAWVCGPLVSPRYLLRVVRSMTQELARLTEGATLRTIGMDDVRSLTMPLPPIDEQRVIVSHVTRHCEEIDKILKATERSISLLKERRSALITAAVTGQIDVSEYAA